MAILLAACTSKPKTETFKVNVNLANADGQTVYLQKDGQVLDSAVIENWDAVFNTPVRDDNEMYGIMLQGWRRPFPFFTDNTEVTLEGDAQNPNAIVVKGSTSHLDSPKGTSADFQDRSISSPRTVAPPRPSSRPLFQARPRKSVSMPLRKAITTLRPNLKPTVRWPKPTKTKS